jgi:hypothetical protein
MEDGYTYLNDFDVNGEPRVKRIEIIEFKKENNMDNIFTENSELKVNSITIGKEEKIVPLSMEIEVKKDSDLYNSIMSFSRFEDFKNKQLTVMYPAEKHYEKSQERLVELIKDCEGAKVKITIKIELEKYE